MSIFGQQSAQPGDVVNPRDAQRILAGQLLQEMRHANQTTTERAARLASQMVNGVLEAGTVIIGADGTLAKSYHVAIGSVVVTNTTGAQLVVSSAAPGGTPPTSGNGVHLVPAGLVMTLPIGSRNLTFFGAAGSTFSIQVWNGLQAYGVVA